ncbi:hypothetical protein SLA2020_377370 [Shorea laevis]
MVAKELPIGRMESEAVFLESVVGMMEENVGWGFGIEKSAIEVGGNEVRAGDERAPCLGNTPKSDERFHRQRISMINSFGRLSNIVFLFVLFVAHLKKVGFQR